MSNIRYVKTNGEGVIAQLRMFFGLFYINSHYLETDKREAEADMLDAISEFKLAYGRYDAAKAEIKHAESAIKNSKTQLLNKSSVFRKKIGFWMWVKSFGLVSVYPEQSDSWEPIANLLKREGKGLTTSVANAVFNIVNASSMNIEIPKGNQNKDNQSNKQRKKQQNNQQDNQQ